DASVAFDIKVQPAKESPGCRCGDVLRGLIRPKECSLFAKVCTTENPVGPCMDSSEGSCAAAFKYEM
ncbi:MAG: hydrogenase formation protein HypD, partial [Deltaproteobacteria bacterium]|nr:hydrogenase formation protein HypD [Deltaproteobacteria bacterium]